MERWSKRRAMFPIVTSPSPLRRAQSLRALDELRGERQGRLAADALEVVEQHRLALRRRLRHPNIARDDGLVDLLAHEAAHVGHYLTGKVVARVVHGQHD